MVESLQELNKRCQKPRYKEVGNWMVRTFLRDAALPCTWLLLHTPVTANQVTAAACVVGVLGTVFLALPGASCFLAGAFLLQLWYYLDHVDGQIARYYGTSSLTGRFFDFVMHQLIHNLLIFSLAFCVYLETGQIIFIVWGFAGSLGTVLFNGYYDTQYKAFHEKLMTLSGVKIKKMGRGMSDPAATETGRLKKIFSIMHKSHEVHVFMNILTLTSVLQLLPLFAGIPWRTLLFIYYGFAAPALAGIKLFCILRGRWVDRDFESSFEVEIKGPSV